MKVYIKIHIQGSNQVIAGCDPELIGKTLKSNKLEIHISENFYKGDLIEIEKAMYILKHSSNINIIGKKIVNACIEEKIIPKEGVLYINEIPMAIKFFM
ncbi:MAG: DUF424 domain-containing protein [Promethearchaeota archaeon]